MSGPFTPEDFKELDWSWNKSPTTPEQIAERANAILAEKRACEKGGEHKIDWSRVRDMCGNCKSCGAKLRARWEAV